MESSATSLTAIDFEDDIKRLTKDFSGRDWVFKDIDDWLNKKSDRAKPASQAGRFFLLTGEPGVGKSAIAARFILIRQYISAYHFCKDSNVETVRPGRILRSLIDHNLIT